MFYILLDVGFVFALCGTNFFFFLSIFHPLGVVGSTGGAGAVCLGNVKALGCVV